jgi:hypothetical protein
MAPWEFHEIYKAIDVKSVPGYPNHYSLDWLDDCPKFDGDHSLAISHIVKFLKYISKSMWYMKMCWWGYLLTLWRHKGIGLYMLASQKVYLLLQISLKNFSSDWGPRFQRYEDTFQDLVIALQEEDIFELVEDTFEEDNGFCEQLIEDFYDRDFLLNLCIERRK